MTDFIVGLGIALAIEGTLYALFPNAMRRFVAEALALPADVVRIGAALMAALGAVIVWLART